MKKGLLIVVSGPSGVGKGTIMRQIDSENDNMFYSISATTRQPRAGEVDGVHYLFITHEDFKQRISETRMLEYAEYCGNYYGTPLDIIEKQLSEGHEVVLEIEVQGAKQVMEKRPDAITIFMIPPSFEELESRIRGRRSEPEDIVQQRLSKARLIM